MASKKLPAKPTMAQAFNAAQGAVVNRPSAKKASGQGPAVNRPKGLIPPPPYANTVMAPAEDARKASRKKEGTASKKTVENQFNKDQSITVFGKKLPKGVLSRPEKVRPKRKSESELEWMYNVTKEDFSEGVKAVGKGIKSIKKKLGK
jgi:hypothetical protein